MSNFIHTNTNNPVNMDLILSINIYKSTMIQFHSCYGKDVYCLWRFETEEERDRAIDEIELLYSTQI